MAESETRLRIINPLIHVMATNAAAKTTAMTILKVGDDMFKRRLYRLIIERENRIIHTNRSELISRSPRVLRIEFEP
jgi:hypothetical protein